ncbi:MAG: PAS domain-containing sensor histidine kinase [Actinomycetia bacterium]|nr:PAS domain-containing sensor histidine kinase [Actinomycetes bacterium]
MSALSDLLAEHTALDDAQIGHVQRLVAEWQLLSDLSFADLLLWAPRGDGFMCVAHCRPTTGPTAHLSDQVGQFRRSGTASPLRVAFEDGRICRDREPAWDGELRIRREAVPVCRAGRPVAVLGMDAPLTSSRSPSQLEVVYLQSAADLAAMIADGTFPGDAVDETGPRVGDGIVRLGPDGTVLYASPNAMSAFRRLGVTGNVVAETVGALTSAVVGDPFDASDVARAITDAIAGGHPVGQDVQGGGAVVRLRALPLRPHGEPLGALLLMQDVTEVRRRDRQIMSKDATIREIHHRVKNNLQTVAALLRLQSRRVVLPEARAALEESMRRIASIALVHETLSASLDEDVPCDEVVDRLLRMLSDVTGATGRISLVRTGSFGDVPAQVATALVLVLTELVQNAMQHAYRHDQAGVVRVNAVRSPGRLSVAVIDDGVGLPVGFTAEASEQLGLQIVRTLVGAELSGTIDLRSSDGTGTTALIAVPISEHRRA